MDENVAFFHLFAYLSIQLVSIFDNHICMSLILYFFKFRNKTKPLKMINCNITNVSHLKTDLKTTRKNKKTYTYPCLQFSSIRPYSSRQFLTKLRAGRPTSNPSQDLHKQHSMYVSNGQYSDPQRYRSLFLPNHGLLHMVYQPL